MASGSVKKVVSPRTGKVSWRARVSWTDASGKRHHLSKTMRTRAMGEAWCTKTLGEILTGDLIIPVDLTVAQLFDRWVARTQGSLRGSTLYRYRQDWNYHVAPHLANVQIARVSGAMIQEIYDAMLAKGYAANTVLSVHKILNGMFRMAERDGLLRKNPCTGRTLPKPPAQRVKVWTPDQAEQFIRYVEGSPTGPMWITMLLTGARFGEILALTWDYVDFKRGTMRIEWTLSRDSTRGHRRVHGAKTASSNRTIVLPRKVIEVLREQQRRLEERKAAHGHRWQDHNLVFPNAYGGQATHGNFAEQVQNLAKALGIPELTPHGLRHTAASLMLASGVHPKVVQEQLGHKTIQMTLDLYSHLSEGMRRTAATSIDAMFGGLEGAPDTTTSRAKQARVKVARQNRVKVQRTHRPGSRKPQQ